jgi:tetratricopeptide (TPR) repeat protein
MSERRPAHRQAAGATACGRLARTAVLALLLASVGCATYSDKMKTAQQSATAGDFASSIQVVDGLIDADPGELPTQFGGETGLALLERGTLSQALGNYGGSARDFQTADKELEFLDLSDDTAGSIGQYVYSDSATKFRTSPTEKLALNGFNMMNYLAQGDVRGARVEARRFTVMRQYLDNFQPGKAHGTFGSYLAGFTMEQLGEFQSAMRYYDEALQDRPFETLREPLARLSRLTTFRGKNITPFLAQGAAPPQTSSKDHGDLLVVVSIGRVPYKVPERMPIGAAIGLAGAWISGNPEVLGYTATKFIVYPELVENANVYTDAGVRVDGRGVRPELASNLGAEIRAEYEAIKPRIIGAAVSRMIVRAAAAEGARAAAEAASDSSGWGWVAALLVEGVMVAADKPDTRSWIFLPERVLIYRERLPAGSHEVAITLGGGTGAGLTRKVEIPAGGFGALIITAPR